MQRFSIRFKHPASNLDRVVFFSDAVIAIAITILVLDVRLPEGDGAQGLDLAHRVLSLWPKCLGYAVSFWVIALYWAAHHRCFRYIRTCDRRLIYLNFLFLMFIAFMPFPTGLLFSNPAEIVSVVLYAGVAAGMGLSLALVWIYAVRRHFTVPRLPRPVARDIRLNLLMPPLVFVFTIGVAFADTSAAMYAWLLLVPVYVFMRIRERSLHTGASAR
jgi:uncharacterized membrane protein